MSSHTLDIFIARQPILDADRTVRAYELLFRNGVVNAFSARDGNEATRQVLVNGFIHFGLQALTGGARAFINLTRQVLLEDYAHLFPAELVVAEILEDVNQDEEVVAACKRLKDGGYTIALDDFLRVEGAERLVELADIVKIDFRSVGEEQRKELQRSVRRINPEVQFLAEKVETYEEFESAQKDGYSLFQGYFFAKPELITKKEIAGNRMNYVRLLNELSGPLDIDRLDAIIRRDMSLSYRLLRYINSAFFGWKSEVRSLRHALALLGERDVRKWASLVALSCLGDDKPLALLQTSLTRARFGQLVAETTGMKKEADELFLLGLFSVIDAIIDRPIQEALSTIAIPTPVADALLGKPGPYRDRLDLVLAYEAADWPTLGRLAQSVGVAEARIPAIYLDAIEWSERSFSAPIDSRRPPKA